MCDIIIIVLKSISQNKRKNVKKIKYQTCLFIFKEIEISLDILYCIKETRSSFHRFITHKSTYIHRSPVNRLAETKVFLSQHRFHRGFINISECARNTRGRKTDLLLNETSVLTSRGRVAHRYLRRTLVLRNLKVFRTRCQTPPPPPKKTSNPERAYVELSE